VKKISVSLNPSYLCNFRCNFCYLTPEQLGDTLKLDLDLLPKKLKEIQKANYQIEQVDLYGGEIGLLRKEYLEKLDDILLDHGDPQLNIITNLSIINPFFLEEHVSLSVSFDFDVREQSDKVLSNILSLEKNVSVLILASEKLILKDIDEMINTFNSISNITSVEIKPYSSNQANTFCVTDEQYEKFVASWIKAKDKMNFNFINLDLIKNARKKNNNSFSDNHIYITPTGKFAVLEFDSKGNEYFLELDTIKEYESWCEIEKERVRKNKFCSKCTYLGHCLTEHYRDVKSIDSSCNGYFNLIENVYTEGR
jgi:MoaA/NifB/PqqE/SkfB family radical SAM enzyme